MKVKSESEVAQLGLTLRDPMDCSLYQAPLSIGILQARILEWVAISSSRGSSQGSNPHLVVSCVSKWVAEGNGTPLQYSCLETLMGRGAW